MMTDAKSGVRRALWKRWLALWPVTATLAAYPVRHGVLRIAVLCCVLLLWAGLLGFYWRKKWLRAIAFALAVFTGVCFVLPGKRISTKNLRECYTLSLRSYEGTRYVWGGGNRLGIDCSGLVRAGLINADLREALHTLNPALLRAGTSLWWHNCSDRALGEEYRQLTRHLFDAPSLNQLDHAQIQPGDLAVTEDGVHVLAFVGEKTWIEADPDVRRVLAVSVPTTNTWFDSPVKLMRWRQLED
jgi:hypothetical protein